MDEAVVLRQPISFRVSEDIQNPDKYIDEIANALGVDVESDASFRALKGLDHDTKVRWLLSLPDHERAIGCAGYLIIITVYLCTMVIVAISATGEPIKEKQCEEKQVEKCVKEKP